MNNQAIYVWLLLLISCKGQTQNIELYSEIDYEPIPKVSLTEYESVQSRDAKYQNPKLTLGVSIAGGGSRAQYFGLGALIGLEEIKPYDSIATTSRNFLKEIDYFSTVSGGCYAAAYYLTIKKNVPIVTSQSFGDWYLTPRDQFKDFVGKSASPALILRNNKNEKGDSYSMVERLDYEVLQYDSGDGNKFPTQMLLGDFFIKKGGKNPTLPMFVANGTIFNNGERIPFMPHIVASLNISESLAPNEATIPLTNGISNGYNFPLAYPITASSAFPGVLPKTKFGIKGSDKIICIIDGGAVDNLGYTTLLELLDADNNKDKKNKRALIIDCSGEGQIERFSTDKKINLLELLEQTSLYTVQTKYMCHETSIKNQLCSYGIPENNAKVIGFFTLRSHLRALKKDEEYNQKVEEMKGMKDKNSDWFTLYLEFRNKMAAKFPTNFKKDGKEIILSSLNSSKFKELSPADILIIYEYAAQTETKLKIFADERDMLLLAGRLTVYIERENLQNMLQCK